MLLKWYHGNVCVCLVSERLVAVAASFCTVVPDIFSISLHTEQCCQFTCTELRVPGNISDFRRSVECYGY